MSASVKKDELQRIIECNQLTAVFQPIVDIQRRALFGYEALIRGPVNSSLHSPLALFEVASQHGMMSKLEYACREISCTRFVEHQTQGKIFLNISPMSLTEKGYRQGMTHSIIDRLELPAERVVIELSEQYPMDDYYLLREATEHFRSEGFEIAIDDLGAGYAGLRAWSEIRPDYVKIDQHFIKNIHCDAVKREFVRSIQTIAQELGCKVVAEGIETENDLLAVQELGLQFGQGFFLGRPEIVPEKKATVLTRMSERYFLEQQLQAKSARNIQAYERIESIAETSLSAAPTMSLTAIGDIFQKHKQLSCLPIVVDEIAIGIVGRSEILELLSHRYSRELHGNKTICNFMNTNPICVSHDTSLEEVSRLLTDDMSTSLTQDFIITRDKHYYGVAKTSALLKRITEQQINYARYANPLTLLPGNVPLHEKIDALLAANTEFRVAYYDLNFFKPFNDHYGYSRGDEVIMALAKLLKTHIDVMGDTVFHVGGDDFVVVYESKHWRAHCQAVADNFARLVPSFYGDDSLAKGGLWGVNRRGDKEFFQFLSIAIGVAHPDPRYCRNYHDVALLASNAKKEAKLLDGNRVFFCQRRKPLTRNSTLFNEDVLVEC